MAPNTITPWVVNVSIPSITTAGKLRVMEIGNQAANGDPLGTGGQSMRPFNTASTNISDSDAVKLASVPEPSHVGFVTVVAFGYLRRRKTAIVTRAP